MESALPPRHLHRRGGLSQRQSECVASRSGCLHWCSTFRLALRLVGLELPMHVERCPNNTAAAIGMVFRMPVGRP
eukprot:1601162-Prymnesium_polylepis.2